MDNFIDLNTKQIEQFFEIAIEVLTKAPKWYNNNNEYQMPYIAEGQMNYSQDFFNTIIESIQILKEAKIFDSLLVQFYEKIYSIELE